MLKASPTGTLRGYIDQARLRAAQDSVPPKSALVGGAIWELKYDGYRAPVRVTGQGAELWSRNASNLSSHFPDLVAAAEALLAAGVVLDGEASCGSAGSTSTSYNAGWCPAQR